MESFLSQLAAALYGKYGDEVSSLTVLFPSRRARLFFNSELGKIVARPLWQPKYCSLDDVMSELSGLVPADGIKLSTELYKSYSIYHNESFDDYYNWGQMLLSDFDSVDRYMIDAGMLFANLADIKHIEADLSYLTAEQRQALERFWTSVSSAHESQEKKRFVELWNTLESVYNDFRVRLSDRGLAYGGMMYRAAAERAREIMQGSANARGNILSEGSRFVIAGFNALSTSEKIVLDLIAKNFETDFFWDYDLYYLENREQEAGLFMRENIVRYPQKIALPHSYDVFKEKKKIKVVSCPSSVMQPKYVASLLNDMIADGKEPGRETAVVLTDEQLLIPMLGSVPEGVKHINVTMGYPLRLTPEYTLVERLTALQMRRRESHGSDRFYHSDVSGLLAHPLIAALGKYDDIEVDIKKTGAVYAEASLLQKDELTQILFSVPANWEQLADYLIECFDTLQQSGGSEEDQPTLSDHAVVLVTESISQLKNTLTAADIVISAKMFSTLLRKVLQNVLIPYEGEPLEGIQIMGILETRNLDFDNVIVISLSDDTFPGNRIPHSFIPLSLRIAYGLPTPAHHEGVFAYYFYRLLQRARNVHLVYSSRSDEKCSGEPSRYIHQLRYESPHQIEEIQLRMESAAPRSKKFEVEKSGRTGELLNGYLLHSSGLSLSPTALSNYISCPLKFYFYSVAGIRPERLVTEQVDAPLFGSILHDAARRLYEPCLGAENPDRYIATITSKQIEEALDMAIAAESGLQDEQRGNMLFIREILARYLKNCLTAFDAARSGYRIVALEKRIRMPFSFNTKDGVQKVILSGIADRIDRLNDGSLWVIDYKTGVEKLSLQSVGQLFDNVQAGQNPAAFQILLYSLMLSRDSGEQVVPALYFLRGLNREDYVPLLEDKSSKTYISSYGQVSNQFEPSLTEIVSEIFNPALPFRQCEDEKHCQWCDFRTVCMR